MVEVSVVIPLSLLVVTGVLLEGATVVEVVGSPLLVVTVVVGEAMAAAGFPPLPLIEMGWAAMVIPVSRSAEIVA